MVGKQLIREYVYLFCAASPLDGVSDFLILPTLSQQTMGIFLQELSARHPNELILMICDGASAHGEKAIDLPDNIIMAKLPPYSPELNPTEHAWYEIREKFFGNFVFKSLNAVEERIIEACQFYEGHPEIIQSITGFCCSSVSSFILLTSTVNYKSGQFICY